jgi:hypothetical protein
MAGTVAERKTMVDRSHTLSVARQARELGISRGSILLSKPVSAADLASMRLREEIAISMDGRGAWRHNVVVERLWRSVIRRLAKPIMRRFIYAPTPRLAKHGARSANI